jgi:small subunit ribosomal protein S20
MPIKEASKKDLRQARKRADRNLKRKKTFKDLTKQIIKAVKAKEADKVKDLMRQVQQALDKAAKVGTIKKTAASRKKSRLAVQVNKLLKK